MPEQLGRVIYSDDCLNVLRDPLAIPADSIDLIYLDPPFNSKNHYNLPFKGQYAKDVRPVEAFTDLWTWGAAEDRMLADLDAGPMTRTLANIVRLANDVEQGRGLSPTYRLDAYLINMAVRLIEMRRVLSPTGSIYLHCDPTASHYLKLLMDAIFGKQNFRNEIAWCYKSGGVSKRRFARKHDIILFYAKDAQANTFHVLQVKSYGQSGGSRRSGTVSPRQKRHLLNSIRAGLVGHFDVSHDTFRAAGLPDAKAHSPAGAHH